MSKFINFVTWLTPRRYSALVLRPWKKKRVTFRRPYLSQISTKFKKRHEVWNCKRIFCNLRVCATLQLYSFRSYGQKHYMCPFPDIKEICLLKRVSTFVGNISVKCQRILKKTGRSKENVIVYFIQKPCSGIDNNKNLYVVYSQRGMKIGTTDW